MALSQMLCHVLNNCKMMCWEDAIRKCEKLPLIEYMVFSRRVNTFLSSFFQFFYNINFVENDFTYSKFCKDSKYAHF